MTTGDIFNVPDIFGVADIFAWSGIAPVGTYYFANDIDLIDPYSVRLSSAISVYGESITTNIFAAQDIFSVQNIFNEEPSQWDVSVEYRSSMDAISPSASWSDWAQISVTDVTARSFQFRVVMHSRQYDVTPVITSLSVQIDMPDRVIADNNITSISSGSNVVFSPAFRKLQGLGINAENMQSGDYYSVTGKTNKGFTIKFYDASGNGVSRRFDYIAKGYGAIT